MASSVVVLLNATPQMTYHQWIFSSRKNMGAPVAPSATGHIKYSKPESTSHPGIANLRIFPLQSKAPTCAGVAKRFTRSSAFRPLSSFPSSVHHPSRRSRISHSQNQENVDPIGTGLPRRSGQECPNSCQTTAVRTKAKIPDGVGRSQ